MPKRLPLSQRFRVALVLAGMNAEQAAVVLGCDQSHLSRVLSGERESKKLVAKIEAFIAEHSSQAVA